MKKSKKYFIPIAILLLAGLAFFLANAKKEMKLTENMFYCDFGLNGRIKFVINQTAYVTYHEKKLFVKSIHPLAEYFVFYKVIGPDGKAYWVCPELRLIKNARGELKIRVLPQPLGRRLWILAFALIMLLLPCGAYPCLRRKYPDILVKFSAIKDWFNVSVILGICWLSLVLVLMGSDNIISSAADEIGYFKTARGMLNCDFQGPWPFTIGLGLWYIPFIIWLQAAEFYDIALQFANFCGFVIMPATMVFIYFIIRKISSSRVKALIAVVLLALFPFFYHYLQDWSIHYFTAFCTFPSCSFDMRFYNMILIRGYNCMSDTPSVFLVMLCVMLVLYLPAKIRFAALVSFIFGFSCLVRMNNLLFSPLLGWLFWNRFTEKKFEVKYLVKAAAVSLAAFIIGFLPQLIINHLQHGAFHITPYHEYESSNGVKWSMLSTGIPFVAGANYAILASGLSGMLFIRDRKLRNTLVLWGIPTLLFFFGYPYIGSDARRFILSSFGAMFAAFVCTEVWAEMKLKTGIAAFLIIISGLLLVTPSGYGYTGQLPFNLQNYSWGVYFISGMTVLAPLAAVVLAWRLRRQSRPMLFVLCFAVLYYAGWVYLFPAVMVLILLWSLYDWSHEILEKLKSARTDNRGNG